MRGTRAGCTHWPHTNDGDGHNGSGHVPISIGEVVGEGVLPSEPSGSVVGEAAICADHHAAVQWQAGDGEHVATIAAQHIVVSHASGKRFGVHNAERIVPRNGYVIRCKGSGQVGGRSVSEVGGGGQGVAMPQRTSLPWEQEVASPTTLYSTDLQQHCPCQSPWHTDMQRIQKLAQIKTKAAIIVGGAEMKFTGMSCTAPWQGNSEECQTGSSEKANK